MFYSEKGEYAVDILSPVCSISPWNIRYNLQSVKRSSHRASGWRKKLRKMATQRGLQIGSKSLPRVRERDNKQRRGEERRGEMGRGDERSREERRGDKRSKAQR